MADHTTTTHRREVLIGGGAALAGLGLSALPPAVGLDPAVAAYHRLVAALTAYEGYDGDFKSAVYQALKDEAHAAEWALIDVPATSPAGVACKLRELAHQHGWADYPDMYEARLCQSAIADLKGLEGRS